MTEKKNDIVEPKILKLTLNKKWFYMISEGVKTEEYREIKKWSESRLKYSNGMFKHYDYVQFKNGYNPNSPTIMLEFKGCRIGKGKKEWGYDIDKEVFIIKLGERVIL